MDAYFTKIHPVWTSIIIEGSAAERERKGDDLVVKMEKEIEPLLEKGFTGSGPFFGGSKELTMAEVCMKQIDFRFLPFLLPFLSPPI